MQDYLPKTKMFNHQQSVFDASRDKEYFALLMEMGTGKTKVSIDTCAYNYAQGKIDAMLVIAPNGVTRMWVTNEIPAHMPEYTNCQATWYSTRVRH